MGSGGATHTVAAAAWTGVPNQPQRAGTSRGPRRTAGLAWLYILQSNDGSSYVGLSTDIGERLRKHRLGLSSKYTKDHSVARLVHLEGPFQLSVVVVCERQVKGWSRVKKMALIRGDLVALRFLSRSRESTAASQAGAADRA